LKIMSREWRCEKEKEKKVTIRWGNGSHEGLN
jgi:hypothetical protein